MTIEVYAGAVKDKTSKEQIVEPILDFKHHRQHILKDDPDAAAERGEDPFRVNPDFIDGAGFNCSQGNFYAIMRDLHLSCDVNHWTPEEVRTAIYGRGETVIANERGINDMLYVAERIRQLMMMCRIAEKHEGGMIVAAG
jgi:hypothetical protein